MCIPSYLGEKVPIFTGTVKHFKIFVLFSVYTFQVRVFYIDKDCEFFFLEIIAL